MNRNDGDSDYAFSSGGLTGETQYLVQHSVVSISLNRTHSELMLICNVVQGDFYSDYDASDFGQGQESQV